MHFARVAVLAGIVTVGFSGKAQAHLIETPFDSISATIAGDSDSDGDRHDDRDDVFRGHGLGKFAFHHDAGWKFDNLPFVFFFSPGLFTEGHDYRHRYHEPDGDSDDDWCGLLGEKCSSEGTSGHTHDPSTDGGCDLFGEKCSGADTGGDPYSPPNRPNPGPLDFPLSDIPPVNCLPPDPPANIPEPSAFAIFGSGLLSLMLVWRRGQCARADLLNQRNPASRYSPGCGAVEAGKNTLFASWPTPIG